MIRKTRSVLALSVVLVAPWPLWAQGNGAERYAGGSADYAEAVQDGRLTLDEALSIALERNRELEDARLALENAEGRVREAWGSVFPTVNLTASYQRNLELPTTFLPKQFVDPTAGPDETVGIQFGNDNTWFAQLRAEQPLFRAAAFLGVGAASRFEALQTEAVRGRAQQVATMVRVGYYDVLLAQEAVRLNAESVSRVRQVLEETRRMNEAGTASDYDVLRLEVQLANLEPQLHRAENDAEATKRMLAVALGVESLDGVDVAGSLVGLELVADAGTEGDRSPATFVAAPDWSVADMSARPLETLPEARVVELAVTRRSDLRQLELTRSLRRTELRVEQSEYLPQLSVFGTYTVNAQGNGSPEFFGPGDVRATSKAVGVQFTMPLFSGLQRPARIAQKRAVVRQVEAQRALVEAQAENEVKTLLDRAREARQRAAAQQRAVSQAQRGFEIARAEYRNGVGSQLQVTDAELALRQSEFNFAQALYDYLTARARLDAAVGTVPMVDAGALVAINR